MAATVVVFIIRYWHRWRYFVYHLNAQNGAKQFTEMELQR